MLRSPPFFIFLSISVLASAEVLLEYDVVNALGTRFFIKYETGHTSSPNEPVWAIYNADPQICTGLLQNVVVYYEQSLIEASIGGIDSIHFYFTPLEVLPPVTLPSVGDFKIYSL